MVLWTFDVVQGSFVALLGCDSLGSCVFSFYASVIRLDSDLRRGSFFLRDVQLFTADFHQNDVF